MRIDLKNPFNEGMNNLHTWRSRYSKTDYPYKVVQNVFYRQYTMNSIWESQIDASFSKFKETETDIIKAFQKLEIEYSNASQYFTVGNRLADLMDKKEDIGGLNYANNIPLITKAQNGDNVSVEELEFTYLYYLLCNKATLIWAGYGRNGFSKIDAITQVTGLVIEPKHEFTYATILNILGKLGITSQINQLYKPLQNFY